MYLARLFLIIITIFIILLWYCFARFFYVNYPDRFERQKVTESDFESGDVLLSSFENVSKMISNAMFRIEFMHPSIVIENDDRKYVVELMNYGNKKGFHMMRLGEWINRNKNNLFLLNKLSLPEGESGKRKEEISNKILAYSYQYSDGENKITSVGGLGKEEWLRYAYPSMEGYVEQDIKDNKVLCTEFVVFLLTKAGIILPTKSVDNYDPDQFIGMKGFDLTEPYMYKEHFLCDISNFFSS